MLLFIRWWELRSTREMGGIHGWRNCALLGGLDLWNYDSSVGLCGSLTWKWTSFPDWLGKRVRKSDASALRGGLVEEIGSRRFCYPVIACVCLVYLLGKGRKGYTLQLEDPTLVSSIIGCLGVHVRPSPMPFGEG